MLILQILIICLFPYLWIRLTRVWKVQDWLSPVVLSYLTGIILANINVLPLNADISKAFGDYTVVLAIPLLLFSTDLLAWLKNARTTVLSFLLCVISGVLCSVLVAFLFKNNVDDTWMISGMLVGVYTGGTPNMNAIGVALNSSSEVLVLMNAADIFCGGIYLIFLTSIAYPIFSKFLPAFKGNKNVENETAEAQKDQLSLQGMLKLAGLTLMILGVSVGLCWLVYRNLKATVFILLLLTTFSLIASMFISVRKIKGSFEMGEYLLLMFCVAVGMQADFGNLWAGGGGIILFTATVLSLTVFLHLIMAKLFKIDVDTVMITSTAALYGPVFVGQIASTIKNRSLIVSGMATGLVGYAVGNYLGISVAHMLKYFLI